MSVRDISNMAKVVTNDYEKMKDPYQKALEKNWQGFKEFYDDNSDHLFSSLTVNGDNAFHFAAASKDALLVKTLLDKVPQQSEKYMAVTKPDNHKNTALHEVATTNCVKVAELMVDILLNSSSTSGHEEENKRSFPNKLSEDPKNLLIRNKLGETPLYRAAALGKTKMVQYLAKKIDPNVLHKHFTRHDDISILHIAIIGQHFETANWLLKIEKKIVLPRSHAEEEGKLTKRVEKNGMTGFNLLALMPSAFASDRPRRIVEKFVHSCLPTFLLDGYKDEDEEEDDELPLSKEQDLESGKNYKNNHPAENQTVISKMWNAMWRWSGLIQGYPEIKKILKEKRKHESARELVELLVAEDTSWMESYKSDVDETISLGLGRGEGRKLDDSQNQKSPSGSPSTGEVRKKKSSAEAPLVMAASNGITEIVKPIIHKYPQAVDYTSDYGQNMLHAAIMFRQKEIFDYIVGMEKKVVQKLAARIDNDGNTLLHQVADMKYYRGGTRPGPALQFQEELEWFENVKAITPSHYTMHRNKKSITAGDLFEEQHAKQFESAQQWMKDTSQSCSTVSILVATVVFAAAYTVPGGNNDQGVPIFLHSPLFWLFTVMDIVSLISSLCSVVLFLSILTSPFRQDAFLRSLPDKLIIGFCLLFFSVLSSMITFTAALLLVMRSKARWTSILVYIAAFIPVVLFALIQFPLYHALLTSLKNFFKKLKCTQTRRKPIHVILQN